MKVSATVTDDGDRGELAFRFFTTKSATHAPFSIQNVLWAFDEIKNLLWKITEEKNPTNTIVIKFSENFSTDDLVFT